MAHRTDLAEKLEGSSLGAEEVDVIVTMILAALEEAATEAMPWRAMSKCGWIDVLALAADRSDRAVARLVAALDDGEGYDPGSSPYDSYWVTVHERALSALYPLAARARALPFLLRLLEGPTTAQGRKGAARVLESIGPAAAAAVPLLRPLLEDPDIEVRAAAQWALERIGGP